jgi:hypothetical protein
VGNHAHLRRAATVEGPRSKIRPIVRRSWGRRDSRSVVAHRRRDEAEDFERAPYNATSDLRTPGLSSPRTITVTTVHEWRKSIAGVRSVKAPISAIETARRPTAHEAFA